MNVILTGMPGSGKTTVSEALGKLTGMRVVDTDGMITRDYGNISDIFDKFGEDYFRDLETETVEKVSKMENVVVSCGGGCLLREKNALLFKKSGRIVFLKTGVDVLEKRLEGDKTRPLLRGNLRERLLKLVTERQAVYEKHADITVETDDLSPEDIARKIAASLSDG